MVKVRSYGKKFFVRLLLTMRLIRACEENIAAAVLQGEVRTPCHLYSGQEAVAAGVISCLTDSDHVFGTHRSHGHYIAKGGDLRRMMAEVFCRETGCSRGRGGSMHLVDPDKGMLGAVPIVAGTIPLALGAALAAHIRGDRRVSVAFFGDGATGEGGIYESLNFASLHGLPVIFVCENNLYATHMPIAACRKSPDISRIAAPFNVRAGRVDGNDVLKVREKTEAAVKLCRAGKGPFFMECLTYRFRGHVGPDDNIQGSHTDIRPPAEIERWLKKDPIILFEKLLQAKKILTPAALEDIRRRAEDEVADALAFARKSPRPDPRDLEKYVTK